ncbi:unnamed protein product [Amoebophrya sp. A120]|nr:unnamed protein product [Amoebophrya sp. A120]|eukprot:GSA120T00019206001.1
MPEDSAPDPNKMSLVSVDIDGSPEQDGQQTTNQEPKASAVSFDPDVVDQRITTGTAADQRATTGTTTTAVTALSMLTAASRLQALPEEAKEDSKGTKQQAQQQPGDTKIQLQPLDGRDSTLTQPELIEMSGRDENYRKKFTDPSQRKLAMERANQECLKSMITETDENNQLRLVNWRTADVKKIGKVTQSVGIELYFQFLHYGVFFFFLWSLLTVFILLACLAPSEESDDKTGAGFLALFSLASFSDVRQKDLPIGSRKIDFYGDKLTTVDVTPWMSAMSALGAFLYLGYVLWFRYVNIAKTAEALDAQTVTPANFTVLVDQLPSFEMVKAEDYATELRKHFVKVLNMEKFRLEQVSAKEKAKREGIDVKKVELPAPPADGFEVTDVAELERIIPEISFARNYGGKLAAIQDEARLKQKIIEAKIDNDEKKIEAVKKQAEKLDKRNQKRKDTFGDILEHEREIFRAYVSFHLSHDKALIEDLYRMSPYTFGYLFQPKKLRFQGVKRICVTKAPEPSNILWENQDCPAMTRFIRRSITKVLVIILLAISTGGILWAQQKQQSEAKKAQGSDCQLTLLDGEEVMTVRNDPTKKLTAATAKVFLDSLPAGTVKKDYLTDCECSAIGISAMSGDVKLACETFYDTQVTMFIITTGSSIIVVAINFLLKMFLVKLANFERPLTVSGLECAISLKVFVALFLNTALLVFLLNQEWFYPMSEFLRGERPDFDHVWFATVGLAISTTLMINIASPHLIQVAVSYVLRLKAYCCGHCCATTEEQIVNAFEPIVFELAPRTGALLNTLYSTLVFAAGCPILIWFATLNHMLCFLADKYLLLRVSKRPPAYDEQVIKDAIGIVPYALLLHAIVGIWMLGNVEVFPSEEFIEMTVPQDAPKAFRPLLTLIDRSLVAAGVPYFLLLLALLFFVAIEILKLFLGRAFDAVGSCLFKCCCNNKVTRSSLNFVDLDALSPSMVHAEDKTNYRDAQQEWRAQKICASYFLIDNEKYEFMRTADVDLRTFVSRGEVSRKKSSAHSLHSSVKTSVKSEGEAKQGEEVVVSEGNNDGDATPLKVSSVGDPTSPSKQPGALNVGDEKRTGADRDNADRYSKHSFYHHQDSGLNLMTDPTVEITSSGHDEA